MKRGDLVKLKDALKDSQVLMYTDQHMKKMEALIYLENFSFDFRETGDQSSMKFGESAVVLDARDIFKDANGADVIWNRFVKIVTSNGICGWVPRSFLTKVFKN